MYSAQLSITDRFIELGNLFFNVKDGGREFQYDLHYESTSTDPVNRFLVDNEEIISDFYSFFDTIIIFIKNIFSKKVVNKNINIAINNHKSSGGFYKRTIKHASTFCGNESSQQVIRNNVRTRLLAIINDDSTIQNQQRKVSNKSIKFTKFNVVNLFSKKKKVVLKNQFMGNKK